MEKEKNDAREENTTVSTISQRRRLRRHAAQLGNTADTIELLSRPQSAAERGPI